MLNTSTQNLIAEVVGEKTALDEMFTAFEVSLEVQQRARGRGEAVERHGEMKETIHQELDRFLQTGVFQRELRDVGAPSTAYVYYPDGEDPTNYQPMARRGDSRKPAAPSTAVTTGSPAVAVATAPAQTDKNMVPKLATDCASLGRHTDARGTLTIPAILMLAANFRPHDKVVFYADDNNGTEVAVISHQTPPGVDPLTEYTVDKDANVRVTATQLADAGIGGIDQNQTYDFVGGSDHVMIKVH